MTIATEAQVRAEHAASLQALDRKHLIHPHQNRARPDRNIFVRGQGCIVWDSEDVPFLDMMSGGNWVVAVGHGRPELAETAAAQAGKLEYFSLWREYSNEPAIRLAARLAELTPPGLDMVHFTSGGSDGTETAIKLARRFHFERGEIERTWIIGRHAGYHGTTFAGGSVSGMDDMHYGIGPTMPHVAKVSPPMLYRKEVYGGQDPTDFLILELEETIHRIGRNRIAAMIGEPVMGGGGVIVPPDDYWPRVRELLSKHGILLIADEVITGFGRTGKWFASAHYNPDIIITAKGLSSGYAPLGAVLMRNEIGEAMVNAEMMFFHGQTYSGHPLACALALANLDLIESESLLGNAPRIESWFTEGLAGIRDLPIVGDVRIHGAMVGIELVTDPATKEPMPFDRMVGIIDDLRDKHRVLARDYGPTLVVGPPLVLDREQAARTSAAISDVLSQERVR
jgi:adenosylmethionine-8-amino-7-oxononanoate aminotransferase